MTVTDEQRLLQQAMRGDETSAAAYGELVRRYQTAVFNTAYRLLGRRVEAEDAAQEAFLRVPGAGGGYGRWSGRHQPNHTGTSIPER